MKKMLTLVIAGMLLLAFGMVQAESYKDAFQFLSPKPGAMYVSKGTYIVIRPGEVLSNYYFSMSNPVYLEGSVSGPIDYEVAVALDGKTLNIKPYREFEPGEVVTVLIDNGLKARPADQNKDFVYSFTVSSKQDWQVFGEVSEYPEFEQNYDYNPLKNGGLPLDRDVSLPSDFPPLWTNTTGTPGAGYIFATYHPKRGETYLLILENDGDPVYYKKINARVIDFKKQPNGLISYTVDHGKDPNITTCYVMNQTYTVIDSFQMVGYELDFHDFQMIDDYHSLMACYDVQIVDMSDSVVGGDSLCEVTGCVIQELDSLKNVVFEWRSWDHMSIFDACHKDFTSNKIDYTHWNSTELDTDGNLLISMRSMDEVTKIDRSTGDIVWRLGGIFCINNMFTFVNDTSGFCSQHDARRLSNGNLTVYDNGSYHTPQFTRAVEYELDEIGMVCTQVWEYRNTPDYYAGATGNAQRLPNDNTLIQWGGGPQGSIPRTITEVAYDGSIVFELDFDTTTTKNTYRCFRFPWTGIASVPYLICEEIDGGFHLIFNKFGDYPDWYKIYMDTIPNPTTAIDSTIDTYYDVTDVDCGKTYYFRVTAIDYTHIESGYSNEESGTAQVAYLPGDSNGDDILMGSDVIFNVNYFKGGTAPSVSCWNDSTGSWHFVAADANGDCLYLGSDVTFMVNYFKGGTEPTYCPQTPPFEE